MWFVHHSPELCIMVSMHLLGKCSKTPSECQTIRYKTLKRLLFLRIDTYDKV